MLEEEWDEIPDEFFFIKNIRINDIKKTIRFEFEGPKKKVHFDNFEFDNKSYLKFKNAIKKMKKFE